MHAASDLPLSALDRSLEGSAVLTSLREFLVDPSPTIFGLSAYALTMAVLGALALMLLAGLVLRRSVNPGSAAWVIRDSEGKIIGRLGTMNAVAGGGALLLFARVLLALTLITGIGLIVYIWAASPPHYRASTTLRVKSPSPPPPFQFDTPVRSQDQVDRDVRDQMVLLKEEDVLMQTLHVPMVRETDWFHRLGGAGALQDLKARLEVRQIPGTEYIEMSMTAAKAKDAPIIVNTLVQKYLGKLESMMRTQYATELSEYQKQEDLLSERLQSVRKAKQEFIASEMGTAGVTTGVNVIGEMWKVLAEEVTRLESIKLRAKVDYENLVGKGEEKDEKWPLSAEELAMVEKDPHVTRLREGILELQIERDMYVAQRGTTQAAEEGDSDDARSPEEDDGVAIYDRQIVALQERLREMIDRKSRQAVDYVIERARTNYLNAIQAELQLRERMQEAEYKQRDLDRHLSQYRVLEEEEDLLRAQLNQIQEYTHQLGMVIKNHGLVRVSQIDPARSTEFRGYSMHVRVTLLVALLLIVTGLWLAFLRAGRASTTLPENA